MGCQTREVEQIGGGGGIKKKKTGGLSENKQTKRGEERGGFPQIG